MLYFENMSAKYKKFVDLCKLADKTFILFPCYLFCSSDKAGYLKTGDYKLNQILRIQIR